MAKLHNEASYSFLIETMNPDGEKLMVWRIDQSVRNTGDSHEVRRVSNSVQRHLSGLAVRTGLQYLCMAEGPRHQIDNFVVTAGIEVS